MIRYLPVPWPVVQRHERDCAPLYTRVNFTLGNGLRFGHARRVEILRERAEQSMRPNGMPTGKLLHSAA